MPQSGARAARDIWWLLLFVLVGQTVLSGFNTIRAARNEERVRHSLTVLNLLDRLQASIIDTETGSRGFVITGDEIYLEPYRNALPETPRIIAELREETADNDGFRARLSALEPLIQKRLLLLQDLIATRRKATREPEQEAAAVAGGKIVMDEIRDRIGGLVKDERELLAERGRVARTTTSTAVFVTLLGGGLSIGVLALANYLIRRQIEIRRQSLEAMRQSEARFKLIAESLPQMVWVASPGGITEYMNQRWHDYTGLSPGESQQSDWLSFVHPDDAGPCRQRWRSSLRLGTPFEQEYRVRRKDGVYRWFLGLATALRDDGGRVVNWFGACTDIDDQKRAADELELRVKERTAELQQAVNNLHAEVQDRERATEQLEATATELARSNRELEQFAYVASHDLQEPLRKIQTFSDRLMSTNSAQLEPQSHDYIQRMHAAAGRMRRLIDDLLTFSRVSKRGLQPEKVDLNESAREVLGDLDDAIQRLRGHVEVGPLPTIHADALQMRQLLQNLIGNALKFHKPDEPPVVTVTGEELARMPGDPVDQTDRRAIRLEVADQGIGFDEAYRERIFQVFQRLHGRSEYEGTGIGLALVRKIAERHGGTVTAHGQPGTGARFVVVLPSVCEPPLATADSASGRV